MEGHGKLNTIWMLIRILYNCWIRSIQVAVIDEGRMYEGSNFNTAATWKDISSTAYANDCFHPFNTIDNVPGVDHD
jgi:hypothetical protein